MKISTASSLYLFLGFSFNVQHVLANDDPPQFVYRADFRDPVDIFQNGMSSLGDNADLIDHVDGRSCNYQQANSAFVATSSEYQSTLHWASEQLRTNAEQRSIYIYRIRASSNFYSVYESLMSAFRRSSPSDVRYRQRADRYRLLFEWVALRTIPANQIERVIRYERDAENRDIVQMGILPHWNVDYQVRSTRGNNRPFDAEQIVSDEVYAVPSNFSGLLTACFASYSQRRTTDTDTCPLPPVPIFKTRMSAAMSTVWDPISRRPVQHVVPWVETRRYSGWRRRNHFFQKPSDCFVEPGARDDMALLQVRCPPNDYYDKFVVLLKAGGSWYTWVDMSYTDIPTISTWKKWNREIPVVDTNYNLADYDYTINEVFASGSDWYSKIKVIPIYPVYYDARRK